MMRQNIRMIGLDLDGTLLDSNKVFTGYSRKIIGEAIERGIIVLPATGRPVSGIPEEILEFPGMRYVLSSNGARVVDMKTGEVLYERLIPYEAGKKLMELLRRFDAVLEIYYDGVGYTNIEDLKRVEQYMPSAPMVQYIRNTRRPVEDVWEMYCREHRATDKIQALFADMDERAAAFAAVRKELPEIQACGALSNNLEANGKGAEKGIALLKLGELLGIPAENIMACGDGSNDIAMIRDVGFGVAMANAIDEVKTAADYVTLSNDEDGVAKAIERYVLK